MIFNNSFPEIYLEDTKMRIQQALGKEFLSIIDISFFDCSGNTESDRVGLSQKLPMSRSLWISKVNLNI